MYYGTFSKPSEMIITPPTRIIVLFVFFTSYCVAQVPDSTAQSKRRFREFHKSFQFSLFPGISTNGISSGFYVNNFSFNLFGGYSAGNRILELGLFTNSNHKMITGMQVAGLANILGTNAFMNLTQSEERALLPNDFNADQKGIQLAGLLNYVLNNSAGIVVSGGLNVVGDDFTGFQLAGMGNSAGGLVSGVQLAGFYNIANEGIGGFQVAGLFNYTDGQLAGAQIALINKARRMNGKHTTPPTLSRSLQLGLLNFSKEMDGLQIGLINFGGKALGTQIGLINFFSKYPTKEMVKLGTPIGLLNFGSRGSYFRLSFNELYPINLERTSGMCYNCSPAMSEMPYYDNQQKFTENALIIGYNPSHKNWGFGYGLQRVLYNKATMKLSPLNRKKIITYGIKFIHLNRSMKFDQTFNLLNRFNLEYGVRKRFGYVFAGLSANLFLQNPESIGIYQVNTFKVKVGNVAGLTTSLWPGYEVGIQF